MVSPNFDPADSARASRTEDIRFAAVQDTPRGIHPQDDTRVNRWEGAPPEPLTLMLSVRLNEMRDATGRVDIPAQPVSLTAGYTDLFPLLGLAKIQYGWGSRYSAELVMDLKNGSFALPACDRVSVSVLPYFAGLIPPGFEVSARIGAAIVPGSGAPVSPMTYTATRRVTSSVPDLPSSTATFIPPTRAVNYIAWLMITEGIDSAEQESLESWSDGAQIASGRRRWDPFGHKRPEPLAATFEERLRVRVRQPRESGRYDIGVRFELSP